MLVFLHSVKISHKILGVCCYLFFVAKALAGTASATFNVTATVGSACTITANNLNFGNYTLGQALTGTTTLSVTCTDTTPYGVGLNQGSGTGATVNTRIMDETPTGSGTLSYSLYQDAAHSTVWGTTTGTGGNVVTGIGNGAAQLLTVYGLIFANNPTAIPGNYQDTIVATVTF